METTREFLDAVKAGRIDQVRQMVQEDPAMLDTRSESGSSAVVLAAYYGQPQVAALLVELGAKLDVFEAAMTGNLARLREILDIQPDLANGAASDGFQPLGLASFFGHQPAVELLLERGAEVNSASQNDQRVIPLHSAAAGQHLEIARLLLAHDADPNARQSGDFTPLHAAAQNGQLDLVKLLLENGADLSLRSEDGRTALDFARAGGHDLVIQFLSSYQADKVDS